VHKQFLKDASYFDDASLKSVADAQIQDQDVTHDDCSFQDNSIDDQQVNTTSPQVNTGSRELSTAIPEINTANPEGLMGPIPTTEDTQEEDQGIDLLLNKKDDNLLSELGFLSAIYEGKTHHDLLHHLLLPDDPIIFAIYQDNELFVKEFEKLRKAKFSMSSMGELTFFLGCKSKQKEDRHLYSCQDEIKSMEMLKKFQLHRCKSAITPHRFGKAALLKMQMLIDVDEHAL
ncbi:hypothetical protein Tco_0562345, partial [Tanacetum coccineum]